MSAILRIAVDVHLFQHLKEAGDDGLSPSDLAEKTGVDVNLLQRLLRHLVTTHLITYFDGKFHGTTQSNNLAEERFQRSISFCYDVARPSFNNFPEYFKKTEYKHPTIGGIDGPFQDAHKTQLSFFEWLVKTPTYLQYFDSFMSAYRAGKQHWYEPRFYPVAERLLAGFDESISDVLLVDVGGGKGHDLAAFAAQHHSPGPGRLILQDREPVAADVVAASSSQDLPFETQSHDFFTPQPVHGARAYYLHSILHDWNDEKSAKILDNLVPALKKGYSRVLFNEIVVSEERPTVPATNMDLMMLAHFAVQERTEAEWRRLLENAGLKVVDIYRYPGVAESLIEAELA